MRKHVRSVLIALAFIIVAAIIAVALVAWFGDGRVANVVDYTVPTTPVETILESVSALLAIVFLILFLLQYFTRWSPAFVASLVILASGFAVGIVIFWLADNLFWLMVDMLLFIVSIIGLIDVLWHRSKRHRR
jgi:hypothetical protein